MLNFLFRQTKVDPCCCNYIFLDHSGAKIIGTKEQGYLGDLRSLGNPGCLDIIKIIQENATQGQHAQIGETGSLFNGCCCSQGRIIGLKGPGNKCGKTTGTILQIPQPLQMFQPFLQGLHMTKHHGCRGTHAKAMRLFHDCYPMIC